MESHNGLWTCKFFLRGRKTLITTYRCVSYLIHSPLQTIRWIIGQRFEIGPRAVFEDELLFTWDHLPLDTFNNYYFKRHFCCNQSNKAISLLMCWQDSAARTAPFLQRFYTEFLFWRRFATPCSDKSSSLWSYFRYAQKHSNINLDFRYSESEFQFRK